MNGLTTRRYDVHTSNYNRLFQTAEGKQLLRKAFTSATGSGETLIAEHLETTITNTMIRLVPELALVEYKFDPQKVHEFSRITALPSAGSAMGESSTTPVRQTTMERVTVTMKIMKRKGRVTGFVQDAASRNYDAYNVEMENHLQAFGNDMATYLLYGNAGADAYQFSGLDRFIATTRTNEVSGGVVPTNLNFLNNMIAASNRRKGQPHRRCFIMSPELLSKVSELYTQVRDNRDAVRGSKAIMIDGGWILQTYREIPILESSQTRPQGQMGAVVYSDAGAGGAIPDDQRFFQVAPVTWDGEQIASTEVNGTSVNADSITLTWTAYTGALSYKIYASDASGTETLVKEISAFTYDGNGTVTGTVTSTTWTSEPLTADTTSVPTHMQADVPLNYTNDVPPEVVFLWDLDPYQGMGKVPFTNKGGSRLEAFATVEPMAKTDDYDEFLIKAYPALVDAFEATCGMHRGLRVE